MQEISDSDIRVRIERDNPWWRAEDYRTPESDYPHRVYYPSFRALALNFSIKRATVLLGPRRVGKTVMLKQLIQEALESGTPAKNILYVSIDTPIYLGISLEKFVELMPEASLESSQNWVVIFDEIQYLRDWQIHLKDLVDNYPHIKFIASGSAAAALQLKSKESGAGRFSDFMLPPLTFYEFLMFLNEDESYIRKIDSNSTGRSAYEIVDIDGLNSRYIDYLNYGGYPEAVTNDEIRQNPEQFIKNDIIDKVLLKDLPSLYGIKQIQELNRLFSFLAYNAGNEASFENISQKSGVTKPTVRTYLEYLESAFLLIKVSTVNDNCKTLTRERNFKIYLNNPSMRAALFAPVSPNDSLKIGQLTECAIFAQWQHATTFSNLRYARWRNEGEVDIVYLKPGDQKPSWIGEIKWSDRISDRPQSETKSLGTLLKKHDSIKSALFTSKTVEDSLVVDGRSVLVVPSAAYCYIVGRNITARLDEAISSMQSITREEASAEN